MRSAKDRPGYRKQRESGKARSHDEHAVSQSRLCAGQNGRVPQRFGDHSSSAKGGRGSRRSASAHSRSQTRSDPGLQCGLAGCAVGDGTRGRARAAVILGALDAGQRARPASHRAVQRRAHERRRWRCHDVDLRDDLSRRARDHRRIAVGQADLEPPARAGRLRIVRASDRQRWLMPAAASGDPPRGRENGNGGSVALRHAASRHFIRWCWRPRHGFPPRTRRFCHPAAS